MRVLLNSAGTGKLIQSLQMFPKGTELSTASKSKILTPMAWDLGAAACSMLMYPRFRLPSFCPHSSSAADCAQKSNQLVGAIKTLMVSATVVDLEALVEGGYIGDYALSLHYVSLLHYRYWKEMKSRMVLQVHYIYGTHLQLHLHFSSLWMPCAHELGELVDLVHWRQMSFPPWVTA
jgi:hypothetical protein